MFSCDDELVMTKYFDKTIMRSPLTAIRRVTCLLAIFIFAELSQAADFSYTSKSPWGNADLNKELVLLEGEIEPGDYNKLVTLIKRNPERFFAYRAMVVASPGGDVQEALKIARFVKGSFTNVLVGDTFGKCESACFLIVAAAPERAWIADHIGVHRPYISNRVLSRLSPSQAEDLQARAFRETRAFMEANDVPLSLIERMFSTSSLEIRWLGAPGKELGRMRPSYEQYLISRCGYDPRTHRRAIEQQDASARRDLVESLNCGVRQTRSEAESFVVNALGPSK